MNALVGHEHEFEAAPGLPEALPRGETLLWQGSPDARRLTFDALHWRALALYFSLLIGWQATGVLLAGGDAAAALRAALLGLPLALLALGLLALVGGLMARSAVYTITDRRVVMRIGIVLTVTFNLPFSQIEAAELRLRGGGCGDIALTLKGGQRIAWLHLWPHARPWRMKHTQPMLRALPDAARVGALLAQAVREQGAA